MINKIRLIILAAGFVFQVCLANEPSIADAERYRALSEDLITAAQPTQADLVSLKKAGVTKIINLRKPSEEISYNEELEAKKLGLEYVSFPISGEAEITLENAQKLHKMLKGEDKVFLHCATGNRVGALLAIRAHELEGKSMDESLKIGHEAGLSSLETRVRSVLMHDDLSDDR